MGTAVNIVILSVGLTTITMILIVLSVWLVRRQIRLSRLDLIREEENQVYLELSSEEQELYFQSKEYIDSNPYIRGELTLSQNLLIQEKGVSAWEFLKDPMLTSNDLMILNRTELNFFKKFECSVQTNLPIPMKNEVYYFEAKIYNLPNPENTIVSIGLGAKPYPWFRLPGRHSNSVCFDSNGHRRYNQPLKINSHPLVPGLIEGDVIGVGYRVRSGTIFFTKNGKKVNEQKLGGHIKHFKIPEDGQIFPCIGANNLCSVHVNMGQLGFVFIEGNVKKWGYAPIEGSGPAPPAYNKFNADILLERSEIDEENDLTDREFDFPPNFWDIEASKDNGLKNYVNDKFSYDAYVDSNSQDERITLESIPANPPSYENDDSVTSELDFQYDTLSAAPEELSTSENTSENNSRDIEEIDI